MWWNVLVLDRTNSSSINRGLLEIEESNHCVSMFEQARHSFVFGHGGVDENPENTLT